MKRTTATADCTNSSSGSSFLPNRPPSPSETWQTSRRYRSALLTQHDAPTPDSTFETGFRLSLRGKMVHEDSGTTQQQKAVRRKPSGASTSCPARYELSGAFTSCSLGGNPMLCRRRTRDFLGKNALRERSQPRALFDRIVGFPTCQLDIPATSPTVHHTRR